MAQRSNASGFLLESPHPPLIRGGHGDYFDGNRPVQAAVERAIDFAHPALTERGNNFIRSKLFTGRQSHR